MEPIRIGLDLSFEHSSVGRGWHYDIQLAQLGYDSVVRAEELLATPNDAGLFDSKLPATCLLRRINNTALFWNTNTGQTDAPILLKEASELAISQVKQPNLYFDAFAIGAVLAVIQVYDPIYPGRYAPHRLPRVAANELVLHRDASNIANVLSGRLANDEYQSDFDHYTKLAFPDYKRIHFQPDPSGEGKIVSSWHSRNLNRPLNLWELSDGMFKYICLLAILLRPNPGLIICLDEPEVGLHPGLIPIVADLIRSASDTAQIIVTTHNPSLVSHFQPAEVIVVEAKNGQSQFRRLSEQELTRWLGEFTLGELMAMGELER